jgi:hypothetical protein
MGKARKRSVPKARAKRKVAKAAPRRKAAPRKDISAQLRSSSRQRVYNLTREVPAHQYFVLANGQPVKHVAELASILDQLEDHVFRHHVTPDRNDFHSWIKDVFQDVDLARKTLGIDDKRHLQLVIYRHLAGHEK